MAKTILVIDDDAEYCAMMAQFLEAHGWQTLQATDGTLGFRLVLKQRPAVILCDLLMPRCNGFHLCRLVRQQPELRDTKIILSSGRDYPVDHQNALDAGADDYLVKPFVQSRILAALERLLNPPPAAPPGSASFSSPYEPPVATPPEDSPAAPGPVLIRFWGVRGSLPTPGPGTVIYGGNTTCVEVRADGEIIILDAGSGLRPLGKQLVAEFKDRPLRATLLLSHTHWDHIQGFPFFIPAYNPKNHLRVVGFEGAKEGLQTILSSQMESPYFPVSMRQMPSNIVVEELRELKFQVGPVEVLAAFANHPGICVGYRLNTSAGSIAFFPDNEPHMRLRGKTSADGAAQAQEQEGETGRRVRISQALDFAQQQDQRLIEFIRGVDVLIIDSQYDDTEYESHVGWGHGCLDDVVSLSLMAGVKRLYLFHHDPDHDDQQIAKMEQWARDLVAMHGDALHVEAAREGLEIVLPPKTADAGAPE
ncbi:MAG: response regulator [Verrucomicrobia bacterium]|nr:response regulator [Verrucomicrobiota bacterium]